VSADARARPEEEVPAYRTLSVIVPVFNERNTVNEVVRRMRRVDLPVDLEIIVVDDGSTDGTDKVLAAIEDSTVLVARHTVNQGKGAAIRTGLAKARGDLIIIQDGDLEYDPADWPRLLEPVLRGTAQVVYGNRFGHEGMGQSFRHAVATRFFALATGVLYDTSLHDLLTGYKLFDRRVLDGITLESDDFGFEPEFTAKVLGRGYRIYEVPVAYNRRARSEGRKYTWTDGVRVLWTLVRCRWARP